MRTTGIVCDVCEKFAMGDEPPEGWFLVVRVGTELKTNLDEACEVCGPVCLGRLATQIKSLDKGEKNQCSDCVKSFPTKQGLSTHRTRVHKKTPAKRKTGRR